MSIATGNDERVLLHCFAGCAPEAIVRAVQLTMADLFPPSHRGRGDAWSRVRVVHSNTSSAGLTLAQYADAKRLPVAFLKSLGLTDMFYGGGPAVRIPYRALDGQTAAVQFRLAMAGSDRFRWKTGSKPLPYGLWRLVDATAAGSIVLVEGASDAQTLWHYGIQALGIPGASIWRPAWDAYLDDIATVFVVLEPDQGGETVSTWIRRCAFRDRVQFLTFEGAKDPSALHLLSPHNFLDAWQQAIDRATPWAAVDAARRTQAAAAQDAAAGPLLRDPLLLDCVGAAMQAAGYAGDLKTPLLVYLAMTSRELERPQNLAVVAPSSAGKNRALDAALALIPPEAVHIVTAASARALIYTEASFAHRVVIFSEADSIPEEGPAASAVRSLAADNAMTYDVTERNPETGEHRTRRIEKAGPTGLITTSTTSLGAQMGTRVLEVPIRDDPDQTRLIMRAHAASVLPGRGPQVDRAPFLALQRWLTAAGIRHVAVPFAAWLAERVPAQAVRMRRDFRQLLTTIQAAAFLHQCQRARTPEGWIAATVADYAIARDLLAPIFDALAAEAITSVIRTTVEAVRPEEEVAAGVLAIRLGVSKSTLSYRLRRALAGGWLVNRETGQGHAARLARGDALPDAVTALPTVAELQQAFECSMGFAGQTLPVPPVPHGELASEHTRWGDPLGDAP
jgi:hypothetical protein